MSSPTWLLSATGRDLAVSWRSAIAWATILGLAAHLTVRVGRPEPQTTPIVHSHTNISLVLAMNWAFCGRYSTWSPRHAPGLANLLEAESTLDLPLSALPARVAGSIEAYCESLNEGYVNAENSLMFVEGLYLRAFPDTTIRGLDGAMRRLQWIFVLPFVAVALRGGASLALAFGIWCAALLTISLLNDAISCSSYGFLGPALLLVVATVGAANDAVARRRVPTCVAVGSIVGFVFGFVGNFRTSYLPIVLAALAVASLCLTARLGRAAGTRGLASILGIALGWWIFHLVFVAPLGQRSASQYSSPEHHFYHPLVLGLANPPNRLAEEEGILWSDSVGLGLAARAEPSLAGAGSHWSVPMATYEAALRKYYFQLWRQRPRDMLEVYWLKWVSSTRDVFPFIAAELPEPFRLLSAAARPVLGNGVIFTAVFLALGAVAVRRSRSSSLVATTAIAGSCACLLLLGFESTAILSGFFLSHQSALLLFVLVAELAAVQAGIDLIAAVSRRAAGRAR